MNPTHKHLHLRGGPSAAPARLLLRRLDGQTRTSDGALAALKQQQQLREPGRGARFQAKLCCQQIEFGMCETAALLQF